MAKINDTKTSAKTASKQSLQPFFPEGRGSSFFESARPVEKSGHGFFTQTKLDVGKPGDHYEKEADAVADKVVQRISEPVAVQAKPIAPAAITPVVQKKADNADNKEQIKLKEEEKQEPESTEEKVQRKPVFESGAAQEDDNNNIQRKKNNGEDAGLWQQKQNSLDPINLQRKAIFESDEDPEPAPLQRKQNNEGVNSSADTESRLMASKSNGESLPAATQSSMGEAIGADFSGVKLHTGADAVQLSKDLGAQAFAHGNHIYFNEGKYNTTSKEGQHLLAHELTHTVQQGSSKPCIQRAPAAPAAPPAPIVYPTIAQVTQNTPTTEGKVIKDPQTNKIEIIISKQKVKGNANSTLLNALPKPVTLPKPSSREDNPTNQVKVWTDAAKPLVQKSIDDLLKKIPGGESLEEKQKSGNTYALKLKNSHGIASLTGTYAKIVNACVVPKWNVFGDPLAFQIEHILDYQLAGDNQLPGKPGKAVDSIDNLMLLNAGSNGYLGAVIKGYVRNHINTILKHYNGYIAPGELHTDVESARTDYDIKVAEYGDVTHEHPLQHTIFLDFFKNVPLAIRNPLSDAIIDLAPFNNIPANHFILKSNANAAGILLPYTVSKKQVGSYEITAEQVDNKKLKLTIKQILSGKNNEGELPEETFTIPGENNIYKAEKFGHQMAQLKIKFLSLVEFTSTEVDDDLNINATGIIKAPTPKFLNNTPIEVKIIGTDLSINKEFSKENLGGKLGPLNIDYTSLNIGLSTNAGFVVSGSVGLSIPKIGKGEINASKAEKGLSLGGHFDFDSKTFDKARVDIQYDTEKDKTTGDAWTITGTITIGKKAKIKGVENASLTIGYSNGELTGDGDATLTVPGVKSANLKFSYKADSSAFNITVTAVFDFKSKIIESANATVTLASGEDESKPFHLSVTGNIVVNIPNYKKLNVTISYVDGLFNAVVTINDLSIGKYLSGNLTIGATNGKPDPLTGAVTARGGDENKNLVIYGKGSITFSLGDNIKSTLDVKVTPEGKILVSGKLTIEAQPLLKKDPLINLNRTFFKIETPKIPLFSVVGLADVFLQIGGEAKANALVHAPTAGLETTLQEIDIFNPDGVKLTSAFTANIAGNAGVSLSLTFTAGASALVLEASATAIGTLGLNINTSAPATLNFTWSSKEGLNLNPSFATLKTNIVSSLSVDGKLSVDLNLYFTKLNIWSKQWKLASVTLGELGNMDFKIPLNFGKNGSFTDPDPNALKPDSPHASKEGAEKLSKKGVVGEDAEPVKKKTEDLKEKILAFFYTLPSIGPTNPKYTVDRGRHFFVKEIKRLYPAGDWTWLAEVWKEEEYNAFVALSLSLKNSSEPLAGKIKQVQAFARDHVSVSKDEIAAQIESLKTADTEGQSKVQKKELPGSTTDTAAKPAEGAGSDTEKQLANKTGSGQPLTKEEKKNLEPVVQVDLSQVRKHTGTEAADIAKGLNAQAFTHGKDIYFGEGKHSPESKEGQHLLAHEVAHTVQQDPGKKTALPPSEAPQNANTKQSGKDPKQKPENKQSSGNKEKQAQEKQENNSGLRNKEEHAGKKHEESQGVKIKEEKSQDKKENNQSQKNEKEQNQGKDDKHPSNNTGEKEKKTDGSVVDTPAGLTETVADKGHGNKTEGGKNSIGRTPETGIEKSPVKAGPDKSEKTDRTIADAEPQNDNSPDTGQGLQTSTSTADMSTQSMGSGTTQSGGSGFASYDDFLAFVKQKEESSVEYFKVRRTVLTDGINEEKRRAKEAIQSEITRLTKTGKSTLAGIQTDFEQTKSAITKQKNDAIQSAQTVATVELLKVDRVIQTKSSAIILKGELDAQAITRKGLEQSQLAQKNTEQNIKEVDAIILSKASQYKTKDNAADIVDAAEKSKPETIQNIRESGNTISKEVTEHSVKLAANYREDAGNIAAKFADPRQEAIDNITKRRDEAIKAIEDVASKAIESLNNETTKLSAEIKTNVDSQLALLNGLPEKAALELDEVLKITQAKITEHETKTANDIENFKTEVGKIFWYNEEVSTAKKDLDAAIGGNERDVQNYAETVVGKIGSAVSTFMAEFKTALNPINTALTEAGVSYKTAATKLKTETNNAIDSIFQKSAGETRTVSQALDAGLQTRINETETKWNTQLVADAANMSQAVAKGLAEQNKIVTTFSSNLEKEFNRSSSWWDDFTDFIQGMMAGFWEGFTNLLSSLWEAMKTLVFWIVVAVIAIVIAILVFVFDIAIAAILAVALVIGVVVGLITAAYYIYKAITAKGITPYERGKLLGRGLFELAFALIGTGVWARLMGWIPRIARITEIIAKVGSMARFLKIVVRVKSVKIFIALIDSIADVEKLLLVMDKVKDLEALIKILSNGDNAVRIMDALLAIEKADDLLIALTRSENIVQILNLVENAVKAGNAAELISLLAKTKELAKLILVMERSGGNFTRIVTSLAGAGDLDKMIVALERVGAAGIEQLLVLLETATDIPALLKLVTKAVDFGSLLKVLGDARDLNKIVALFSKVNELDKMVAVFGKFGNINRLLALFEKATEINKLLTVLDRSAGLEKLVGFLEGLTDLNKAIPALEKLGAGLDDFVKLLDEPGMVIGKLEKLLSMEKLTVIRLRELLAHAGGQVDELLAMLEEIRDLEKLTNYIRHFGKFDHVKRIIAGAKDAGMGMIPEFLEACLTNGLRKVDNILKALLELKSYQSPNPIIWQDVIKYIKNFIAAKNPGSTKLIGGRKIPGAGGIATKTFTLADKSVVTVTVEAEDLNHMASRHAWGFFVLIEKNLKTKNSMWPVTVGMKEIEGFAKAALDSSEVKALIEGMAATASKTTTVGDHGVRITLNGLNGLVSMYPKGAAAIDVPQKLMEIVFLLWESR